MSDQVITQTAPTNTAPTVPPVQANEVKKPEESIVSRASKVSLEQPQKGDAPSDSIKLDQAMIDKIADPALKASVQEAYKSMQADYTRKTQTLADMNRQFEEQLGKMKNWTPERVQEELQNPSFVKAAQEYQRINGGQNGSQAVSANGDLTAEEFSYLSPEQQKLYTKTKQMEETMGLMNSRLQSAEVEKQDMALKGKYANYDPKSVNEIYDGMMNGTIQATREHLWKVKDYEDMARRSYELGRQDEKNGISQARQATAPHGAVTTQTIDADVPTRLKGESFQDFWKRLSASAKSKIGQT
jgi:hypothetical protein